ncbi:MAG: hypothetical protein IK095_10225 [Oscillospiraceae bacterium]|nr:hypothetical protein [Oscillospiraceae bacterium]
MKAFLRIFGMFLATLGVFLLLPIVLYLRELIKGTPRAFSFSYLVLVAVAILLIWLGDRLTKGELPWKALAQRSKKDPGEDETASAPAATSVSAPADGSEPGTGTAADAKAAPDPVVQGPAIDDVSYIRKMVHLTSGPWHQYDVLLAARGYGWETMLDWADYLLSADLEHLGTLTTAEIANAPEKEWIDSFQAAGGELRHFPPFAQEQGVLAIGANSRTLRLPVKIVWFDQTKILRFFTLSDDEELMTRYIETVIRRTFGTPQAMGLARPVPPEPGKEA